MPLFQKEQRGQPFFKVLYVSNALISYLCVLVGGVRTDLTQECGDNSASDQKVGQCSWVRRTVFDFCH